MKNEYTYQDMLKMQEDAAKRVREMKRRAALAVSDEPPQRNPDDSGKRLPDEVKHISYPVELPVSSRNEPEDRMAVQREQSETSSREPVHGLLSLLTEDPDAMLILSLLAVIGQDEQDTITSLALLYLLL